MIPKNQILQRKKQNNEEKFQGLLNVLLDFRREVKKEVLLSKGNLDGAKLLHLTDKVREKDLLPLGIRIQDEQEFETKVLLEDPEVLIAQQKAQTELMRKSKQSKDETQSFVPPRELFKNNANYSQFDAEVTLI